VTAAYPYGSRDIKSSMDDSITHTSQRIGRGDHGFYRSDVGKVDVVLYRKQWWENQDFTKPREVIQAKKPSSSKTWAASFADTTLIYQKQKRLGKFRFSRLLPAIDGAMTGSSYDGKIGKVLGCDSSGASHYKKLDIQICFGMESWVENPFHSHGYRMRICGRSNNTRQLIW